MTHADLVSHSFGPCQGSERGKEHRVRHEGRTERSAVSHLQLLDGCLAHAPRFGSRRVSCLAAIRPKEGKALSRTSPFHPCCKLHVSARPVVGTDIATFANQGQVSPQKFDIVEFFTV